MSREEKEELIKIKELISSNDVESILLGRNLFINSKWWKNNIIDFHNTYVTNIFDAFSLFDALVPLSIVYKYPIFITHLLENKLKFYTCHETNI